MNTEDYDLVWLTNTSLYGFQKVARDLCEGHKHRLIVHGDPKPTDKHTVEQLKGSDIVGLYEVKRKQK